MENMREFRTYKRRSVTRRTGNTVCGDKSGGECIILKSEKYELNNEKEIFTFYREHLQLEELFESDFGIIAFGGYLYTQNPSKIDIILTYEDRSSKKYEFKKTLCSSTNQSDWQSIGFHNEVSLNIGVDLYNVTLQMIVHTIEKNNNILQFIGFDFNVINFYYYKALDNKAPFYQKTSMHIPQLYYFDTLLPINTYLIDDDKYFSEGDDVILKSCNRCGRYLPININNPLNTLAFSLHCKKKAPCKHSTFDKYTIENIDELEDNSLGANYINENNRVVTYYGHQLECTSCKKFFVNLPLNPIRTPQQYKEDGLRRRSTEILVNNLLKHDLIHHEFEKLSGKQFSEYIWKKFNKRCFKCGKKLSLDKMHLDHTMPLAYLYRLDETASCLCAEHNSSKRDSFPVDFYTEEELIELQKITGIPYDVIRSRDANPTVIKLLVENVTWFFDVFLAYEEYQEFRSDRLTADKIYASIVRVLPKNIDLIKEYYNQNNHFPKTITMD